jgi:DNA-binding transcriptional LysR family regulator
MPAMMPSSVSSTPRHCYAPTHRETRWMRGKLIPRRESASIWMTEITCRFCMDPRQLEYVVAVAEERSFTRAAQRCHIAQSALSHQIARLETEIRTKIFERTSRSVRLSEAGQVLLPHARRVLDDLATAQAALDSLARITRGRLRIGMTQTASKALNLISVVGELHRQYPDISLSTATGPGRELIGAVCDGELDIALAALTPDAPPAGVTFRPVVPAEPLVVVVPLDHPLAQRKRVRIRDLAEAAFVDFRRGTTLRETVERAVADAGMSYISSFEVGQISDMVAYAAAGLGVSIVPRVFTLLDPMDPTSAPLDPPFRVLQLVDPAINVKIGAYVRHDRTSTAVSAFLEQLDGARTAKLAPPRPDRP